MLRCACLVALGLAACGDDDSGGGVAPDAPADSPGTFDPVCEPTGLCENGPMCGASCCAAGEQCVENECRCGNDPACLAGDYCIIPGPVAPGAYCGSFCCGPVSGQGCPI